MSAQSLVIDASVALKWLLPEQGSTKANTLLETTPDLIAPDLIYPEIGNVLWKRVQHNELTPRKAMELVEWFSEVPMRIHASRPLVSAAVHIATEHRRSVYDSLYVALAIAEEAVLVTADAKLFNALKHTSFARHVQIL